MWTQELRRQHRHVTTHWQGPQPCSLAPEVQADVYASFRIHNGLLRDPIAVFRKRQRFSPLAAIVARCLFHVPGQQGFNLFQRIGRRDVLQYMM